MEKNTFGKVLKQFCAVILSAVLIFNSFAFTVYAFDEPDITQGGDIQAEEQENGVDVEDVEDVVDSEEPEDESGFIADLVITGFVELLPEVAVIYIDKLDSIDDALALLPAALKVTAVTGEVSEIIDLPVTWSCAEPFEEAPKDEYVFSPSWDETAYALSPELDLSTVVTVTVRVGEAPVEEEVEEDVEGDVEGDVEEDEEPLPMAFKSADSIVEIFLNVDQNSGHTFEEVKEMLEKKLGPNVRIMSKRQNVSTTDLRDWHIYDHYDTNVNCWDQTDDDKDKIPDAWEEAYKEYLHRPYYSYTELYPHRAADPVYTIKDWIDNDDYIHDFEPPFGRLKVLAQFKEHIYSDVGTDGKPFMIFGGYGTSYLSDFLFYNPKSNGKKFVDFDVDSSQINTHTLRGTGFLVNCGLNDAGDKISGYLVYYSYVEDSTKAQEIRLYKLDNVDVNKLHFSEILSYDYPFEHVIGNPVRKVPITNWDNNMSIQIIAEPTKIEVRQQPKASSDKIENQTPIISFDVADTGYSGFGPLVDYTGKYHTCKRASSFTYSNLRMAFTTGVASEDATILDSYQSADFTQDTEEKKVQKYFINYLGNSDSVYNTDGMTNENFANYPAYLELMQKENVALITDRETPFGDYLGDNLHEGSKDMSLEDFVNNIAGYLNGKNDTQWDNTLSKPSNAIPIPNPVLTDNSDRQLRSVIRVTNKSFEININDKGANSANQSVIYTLIKPDGNKLVLNSSAVEITSNANDFPAGEYTVRLSYENADGTISPISGNAYFTVERPSPNTPTYSVTYDANGGQGAPNDQYGYYEGGTVDLIFTPAPTKDTHAFVGWSSSINPTSVTAEYMAEGPSSSMVMPGRDVTLYAVWAKELAVIYNSMGGSSISPVEKLNINAKAPKPADDPVRAGYIFDGWYKEEDCENPWDFDTDTIIGNTTLYAKWTQLPQEQPRPKIDGITSYPGGTIAPRANVRLVKGNTEFGNTTADESGYYSFHNIPVGYYNAIITLGEHIVTKLVQVTNPTFFEDKATIPPMLENSVVAIGVNSPEIVVGKIDHLFGIQTADGYSTVDKELVMRGGKAQMTMSIEEKAKADMNLSQKQQAHEISIKATENKKMVDSYFDFTLSKNVGSNSIYFEQGEILEESFLLLPIIIPLSHELRGYSEFEVYRYHEGRVDIISAVPNENGEYLSWDGESLFIYAKGFSMYALTVPMKNTQPQTGSSALPIPIMPVAAAAMTLFMAKFLLWQYEFEIGISQEERDRMVTALIDWAKGTTAIKIGVAIVCLAFVFASYNLRRFISKVIRALGKDA